MLQNRPIALTLIAAVLMYQGLEAFFGMFGALTSGTININLTFLLFFAGIGLLRLSDAWRLFSLFVLCLGGLVLIGLVVFELIKPGQLSVTWFGTALAGWPRYVLFVVLWIATALLLAWTFRTLTRPEIVVLFRPPNKPVESTSTAVTPGADAPGAPSAGVPHQ